jgi:putative ABC transport system permease protein
MIGKESIKYSLRNLKNRKTRSAFTIFSIMMGITTIFIFVSFGIGLYNYIDEVSAGSSINKIFIQPKGTGVTGVDTTFSFNDDDVDAVKSASGVYDASGVYFRAVEIKKDKKIAYTYLIAYDPAKPIILEMSNLDIYKGRELKTGDTGVVAGYGYMFPDKVFSKGYELNQNIEINGREFKIIGFYDSVGNPQDDAQLYITNDMMKELFGDDITYNWIIAEADVSKMDVVVDNVERNLRKERGLEEGKEDFFAQTFEDMMETYTVILDVVIGFIIIIALISILVSSINTANTMITSVLERKKEIGIIKSIGGTNAEVLGIFLFESAFLGFLAGCIGVFFGWLFSFIGGQILETLGYGFLSPYFSFNLFAGCILFAVVTGAISGVIPAVKASRTNPVETLRYE